VREPALALIGDLQQPLAQVSRHFRADPKKVGGSLFRVLRDTRFEHEGGPYKPWIGLRFHHERKRDVHAPGYFVHIAPTEEGSFLGGGLWRPEGPTLNRLRSFLQDNPVAWQKLETSARLARYPLDGEMLQRPPRGVPVDHPLVDALRRKSFVRSAPLPLATATSPGLKTAIATMFTDLGPFMDYLCAALDLDF